MGRLKQQILLGMCTALQSLFINISEFVTVTDCRKGLLHHGIDNYTRYLALQQHPEHHAVPGVPVRHSDLAQSPFISNDSPQGTLKLQILSLVVGEGEPCRWCPRSCGWNPCRRLARRRCTALAREADGKALVVTGICVMPVSPSRLTATSQSWFEPE